MPTPRTPRSTPDPLLALFPLVALACAGAPPAPRALSAAPHRARVVVATDHVAARVSERFLSVAVDALQTVGGSFWGRERAPYDFSRPRLRRLARALAPAYLRVGGSDADKIYYALGDEAPSRAPAPYERVMTRAHWDAVNAFASDLGYRVVFTLNAGPGPRDAAGRWTPENARALVAYSRARDYPVDLWELGNEPNGFQAVHGVFFRVAGAQLARDFVTARAMLDESAGPRARLGGPASAYWPVVGEIAPVFPAFMAAGGGAVLDVITWHYYPQQSRRCAIATRPADADLMFRPHALNEVLRWADAVESARSAHAPRAEVWLGETGNAQCGGEPGVSDAFAGGFWWLDQLGAMARRGEQVVVRQTLSGSDYGLLDEATLEPNPDYWNSLLWRRLMSGRVLRARVSEGEGPVRAYAHCAREGSPGYAPGAVSVLLLNLDRRRGASVDLEGALGDTHGLYAMTAPSMRSRSVWLNGTQLVAELDGALPTIAPRAVAGTRVDLAPGSYAFAVFHRARASACRRAGDAVP